MSDFTITHRAGLPDKPEACTELAGAVFVSPSVMGERDGPDYYKLITLDELDRYLDSGEPIIYGSSQEIIENQLYAKHPAPLGTTKLLFIKDYETPNEARKVDSRHSRRRYYGGNRYLSDPPKSAWLVLPRPLVESDDEETLRTHIADVGSVLIDGDGQSEERWRERGFTATIRYPNLLQLSFNPKRVSDTFFKRAVADYNVQMRGYFPNETVAEMWRVVSESCSLGYGGIVTLRTESRAYGEEYRDANPRYSRCRRVRDDRHDCIRRCYDWCDDILHALALIKRLKPDEPAGWYRGPTRADTGEYTGTFASTVRELLPWLAGVEALMKLPDADRDKGPLWVSDDIAKRMLQFCRWLRQEARAMNIKIPPKPKPPQRPKVKKAGSKRRAASKGSGAKARRSRTKSTELASPAARTP